MTIKKVKEIAYGDQTAVELDINGKWQKGYGTIVVIEGYKFIFVPRKYSNGINIEAYSLDSLKLFDSKPMSFITALLQCATKEGFMEVTAPLAIKISEQLNKMKSLNGWKEIFRGEYLSAIAECGARSEKERRLLKEFDSKGVSK